MLKQIYETNLQKLAYQYKANLSKQEKGIFLRELLLKRCFIMASNVLRNFNTK